jgi:hypothetical protein
MGDIKIRIPKDMEATFEKAFPGEDKAAAVLRLVRAEIARLYGRGAAAEPSFDNLVEDVRHLREEPAYFADEDIRRERAEPRGDAMATMGLSIPDDVREAFNKTFEGMDQNAVVASLMRKAIEEREPRPRPGDLVERMRRIRASGRSVSDEEIKRARQELRE